MIDQLAIIGAKYLFFGSMIIAGVYVLRSSKKKRRKLFFFSLLTIPLIYFLGVTANQHYNNPRPFVALHFTPLIPHAADNGFPSDHVLLVAAIAAVFTYFNRRVGLLLWGIAVLVAISRVYVGVHHASDVIASMGISAFGAFLVDFLMRLFGRKSRRQTSKTPTRQK